MMRVRCRLSSWLSIFGLIAGLTPASPAQGRVDGAPVQLVEATIDDLHAAMDSGLLTAEGLAGRYRLRVAAYEDVGPQLNALIRINPALDTEARRRDLDAQQTGRRGPLFGIPVLLKDNIDALPMATTAGSVALAGSLPPDDAFITTKLRQAGAVIFGKATMTEFANFMTLGMPNGYSSLGGHGVNPYDPRRGLGGEAIVDPGGSSSGSGIATAANLVSVAIGTETSGSILSPSSSNGVVGIKPTLGLVSRDGILPITAAQDTAGPIARSVTDAARLLGVISGFDPNDPATAACQVPGNCFSDYTQFLDRRALAGARIAVPPAPFGLSAEQRRIVQAAIASMRANGAVVVDPYLMPNPNLPPICVSHPPVAGQSTVLIFGMKRGLDAYLAGLGPQAPIRSLAQIIAHNQANAATALRYGQSILVACDRYDARPGSADEARFLADRQLDVQRSRAALDAVLAGPDGQSGTADDFDAMLFPANFGADAPARAGYPSICVPAGMQQRGAMPALPFGITLTAGAFSEPRLIALAYAFEQATGHRAAPASAAPLPTDTILRSLPGVTPLGSGCAGANGIPQILSDGPPIIGNGSFGLSMSSLRAHSPVFVGLSARRGFVVVGGCIVRAALPFQAVLAGTSDAAGAARLGLPIPFLPSIHGQQFWLQGGVLDPSGAGAGLVSLTAGLEITVGG